MGGMLRTQFYPDWNNRKMMLPIVVNLEALLYATPHTDGTWIRYNGGDCEKGLVLGIAWQDFVDTLAPLSPAAPLGAPSGAPSGEAPGVARGAGDASREGRNVVLTRAR